ncbi:hypothetical protein T484DRAFT_2598571 [Baffinella frigidus]|nr:hypothetical protein T484DRAFT_2598571 [Cryptophyta sp. CCMP2293]
MPAASFSKSLSESQNSSWRSSASQGSQYVAREPRRANWSPSDGWSRSCGSSPCSFFPSMSTALIHTVLSSAAQSSAAVERLAEHHTSSKSDGLRENVGLSTLPSSISVAVARALLSDARCEESAQPVSPDANPTQPSAPASAPRIPDSAPPPPCRAPPYPPPVSARRHPRGGASPARIGGLMRAGVSWAPSRSPSHTLSHTLEGVMRVVSDIPACAMSRPSLSATRFREAPAASRRATFGCARGCQRVCERVRGCARGCERVCKRV